jgi:hypothetical protein
MWRDIIKIDLKVLGIEGMKYVLPEIGVQQRSV